jgi:DNA replication and repair protein RecF
MSLQRLDVYQLRNIKEARLSNFTRVNIIAGTNGAGKTSLLEAIYLLGMGRSFRGARIAPLIASYADALTVYGELIEPGHYSEVHGVGLTKTRSGQQHIHLDKKEVSTLSELVRALPVQLINADTFLLIEGGPMVRRQFLDWGVFHVKHGFVDAWRRAQKCLKQRNMALKQFQKKLVHDRARIHIWDKELSDAAKIIDTSRAEYIKELIPLFFGVLGRMSVDMPDLSFQYKRGWRDGDDLSTVLLEAASTERDFRYATSTIGPHRANLEIMVGKQLAADVLSRGQKKIVVSAMKLAQGQYFMENTGRQCVFLVDDLPAELDRTHRNAFCALLDEMKCQIFMTTVDEKHLEYRWINPAETSLFHVEQGHVNINRARANFIKKVVL